MTWHDSAYLSNLAATDTAYSIALNNSTGESAPPYPTPGPNCCNNNGTVSVKGCNSLPLPGALVVVKDSTNTFTIGSVTTDSSGVAVITGLAPSTNYKVTVTHTNPRFGTFGPTTQSTSLGGLFTLPVTLPPATGYCCWGGQCGVVPIANTIYYTDSNVTALAVTGGTGSYTAPATVLDPITCLKKSGTISVTVRLPCTFPNALAAGVSYITWRFSSTGFYEGLVDIPDAGNNANNCAGVQQPGGGFNTFDGVTYPAVTYTCPTLTGGTFTISGDWGSAPIDAGPPFGPWSATE